LMERTASSITSVVSGDAAAPVSVLMSPTLTGVPAAFPDGTPVYWEMVRSDSGLSLRAADRLAVGSAEPLGLTPFPHAAKATAAMSATRAATATDLREERLTFAEVSSAKVSS